MPQNRNTAPSKSFLVLSGLVGFVQKLCSDKHTRNPFCKFTAHGSTMNFSQGLSDCAITKVLLRMDPICEILEIGVFNVTSWWMEMNFRYRCHYPQRWRQHNLYENESRAMPVMFSAQFKPNTQTFCLFCTTSFVTNSTSIFWSEPQQQAKMRLLTQTTRMGWNLTRAPLLCHG